MSLFTKNRKKARLERRRVVDNYEILATRQSLRTDTNLFGLSPGSEKMKARLRKLKRRLVSYPSEIKFYDTKDGHDYDRLVIRLISITKC